MKPAMRKEILSFWMGEIGRYVNRFHHRFYILQANTVVFSYLRGLNIPSDIFYRNILYTLEKNNSIFLNYCASWGLYGCWGGSWWGNRYNSIYKHMQRTIQYQTGYMACWGNSWSCQPCIVAHITWSCSWNKSHCLLYSRCCIFQITARRFPENIPKDGGKRVGSFVLFSFQMTEPQCHGKPSETTKL